MTEQGIYGDLEVVLKAKLGGEVRFDSYSKVLYSTDASNYQIEPVGVVVPRSTEDVIKTIEISKQHNVPILPRGGGYEPGWTGCWPCISTRLLKILESHDYHRSRFKDSDS